MHICQIQKLEFKIRIWTKQTSLLTLTLRFLLKCFEISIIHTNPDNLVCAE